MANVERFGGCDITAPEDGVIRAVETAKRREDVVPAYVALIRSEVDVCVHANAAILGRWSASALDLIKRKAWAIVDPDGRAR